jgi:hypothetical protein
MKQMAIKIVRIIVLFVMYKLSFGQSDRYGTFNLEKFCGKLFVGNIELLTIK